MNYPTIILHIMQSQRTLEAVHGLDFEHAILGKCHGVLLRRRAHNDKHVVYQMLVEDDETWHAGGGNTSSSFWLPDTVDVITKANEWVKQNCIPDPSGYGYMFK